MNTVSKIKIQEIFYSLFLPVSAVSVAFLIGGLILLLSGKNPISIYLTLFQYSIGTRSGFFDSLLLSTPLIFTGLATAISFRAGIWNIGIEGSLYIGAFASAWVAFTFIHLPGPLLIFLSFLLGGIAGGLWGLFPGFLRAFYKVDEVVSTIMLNYVAILFTSYLVNYPFAVPGLANAMSKSIAKQAFLKRLAPPSQFNISYIIALFTVIIITFTYYRTTFGYETKLVGLNPIFARWSGISTPNVIVKAFFVSGILGGIAGSAQVLGVNYRFIANFSPGYGFDGLAIALLSRLHPIGIFASATLFGMIRSSIPQLEIFEDVPKNILGILEASIMLFATATVIIEWAKRRKHAIR